MNYIEEVADNICKSAAQTFSCDASKFDLSTNLGRDFNAKSINLVQIIGYLEDEYEVEIDFMVFKNTTTIEEAAEYVASLL